MNNKNFFSGLEELFARLVSFILVALGFVIFMIARDRNFDLNWLGILQILALFWLLYEVLGLIFFQVFHFFAKQQSQIQPQIQPQTSNSLIIPETENSGNTEKSEMENSKES